MYTVYAKSTYAQNHFEIRLSWHFYKLSFLLSNCASILCIVSLGSIIDFLHSSIDFVHCFEILNTCCIICPTHQSEDIVLILLWTHTLKSQFTVSVHCCLIVPHPCPPTRCLLKHYIIGALGAYRIWKYTCKLLCIQKSSVNGILEVNLHTKNRN